MIETLFAGFADFFTRNAGPILFYGAIIFLIYFFRDKLEWQGRFIGLYKTQVGVKLMKKIATKFPKTVRGLGYVGVPVGFLGMTAILALLLHGLWKLLFVEDAPAVVGLVLPGVHIPGLSVAIPLITGWLALFVVIVVHEFSHGVVSKAHKIPIQSSGLLFFGPLLGAFVEPHEKKLTKAKPSVQLSVFAAGPFSNILAMIFFGLVLLAVGSAASGMVVTEGVELVTITEGMPAAEAGLETGTVIIGAQGLTVSDSADFIAALDDVQEGDTVTLVTQDAQEYTLTAAPDGDPATTKGLIGVNLQTKSAPASDTSGFLLWLNVVYWILDFLKWVILLNLGIGLANLLPIGPVDGGRMMQTLQVKLFGKKQGLQNWKNISVFTIVLLIVVFFLPLVKTLV